jgi:hypothetical protein
MFARTSRRTIPEALDSNEAHDVLSCNPPNGSPALRPAPDRGAQIKIEQQRALKKPAPWGGSVTARVDISHRSVVAPAQRRKKKEKAR